MPFSMYSGFHLQLSRDIFLRAINAVIKCVTNKIIYIKLAKSQFFKII